MNTFEKYSTKSNITIMGGNVSIKSFEDWRKSVPNNPVLVKFGIATVFDLLTA